MTEMVFGELELPEQLSPEMLIEKFDVGVGDFRVDGENLFVVKDETLRRVANHLLAEFNLKRIADQLGPEFSSEHIKMHLMRRINKELYVELGRYCMIEALARTHKNVCLHIII